MNHLHSRSGASHFDRHPPHFVSGVYKAIGAYKGLAFGPVSLKPDGKMDRMETVPPANYDEQQLPRVRRQLEKAAIHLAQLLNSVRFK